MYRILLIGRPVGDIASPAEVIAEALRASGSCVVRCAPEASDDALWRAFEGRPPDVLLVDLSGHDADTVLLRHLARRLKDAWGGEDDGVTALQPLRFALLERRHLTQRDLPILLDEMLLPPYDPEEAQARLRLHLFRRRHIGPGEQMRYYDLTLDLAAGRALDTSGADLPLTPREWDLLRFLLAHQGKRFSRERLLDLVWGVQYEGGARTVDIHVRRLRAKLPPEAAARLETHRGVGYGFAAAR